MSDFSAMSTQGLGNGVRAVVERVFDEAGLCMSRGPWSIEAESEVDVFGGEVLIGLRITRRPELTVAAFAGRVEVN